MKRKLTALLLIAALIASLSCPALASLTCVWCRGTNGACRICSGTGKVGSDPDAWRTLQPDSGGVSGSSGTGGSKSWMGISYSEGMDTSPRLAPTELTIVKGRKADLFITRDSAKWRSSNKKVATVSEKGATYGDAVVTAKGYGTCTITATMDGVTRKCKVTVVKKTYASGIRMSKKKVTLMPGEYVDLKHEILPTSQLITEPCQVTESSSDETIVTVDYGRVTAVKPGKATITKKLEYKKGKYKTVKCTVTVETGLARFKRWFNKNCVEWEGYQAIRIGENEVILYDATKKQWIFQRWEETGYNNGTILVQITFNKNFTGKAKVDFYWGYERPSGLVELECSATAPVKSLSWYYGFDWQFTKGKDKHGVVVSNLRNMMSTFNGLLRDKVNLKWKVGWRDLGLKSCSV